MTLDERKKVTIILITCFILAVLSLELALNSMDNIRDKVIYSRSPERNISFGEGHLIIRHVNTSEYIEMFSIKDFQQNIEIHVNKGIDRNVTIWKDDEKVLYIPRNR